MDKLDLQIHSQTGTHLYVGDLLYTLITKKIVSNISQNFERVLLDLCPSVISLFFFLVPSKGGDGEGNGTPLQDSCLENPMDRGAWWAAGHGVTKSRTQLSDFTFTHWRRTW